MLQIIYKRLLNAKFMGLIFLNNLKDMMLKLTMKRFMWFLLIMMIMPIKQTININ